MVIENKMKDEQWINSIAWPESWMRDVALSALPYGMHTQWYVWAVKNSTINCSGFTSEELNAGDASLFYEKLVCYDSAGQQSEWVKDNIIKRFWNFISPNMSKIRSKI